MNDAKITDQDIQAYVDNELGWEEEKFVRAYIAKDSKAQKRYDDLVKQKKLLLSWWKDKKH